MPTTQEQWDKLIEELRERELACAKKALNGPIPPAIYHVTFKGNIETRRIQRVGYRHPNNPERIKGKHPTLKDVSMLRSYLKATPDFEEGQLFLYWEIVTPGQGTTYGVTNFQALSVDNTSLLSRADAERKSVEVTAVRNHEKKLVESRHTSCRCPVETA